jgi:hypothetical protein
MESNVRRAKVVRRDAAGYEGVRGHGVDHDKPRSSGVAVWAVLSHRFDVLWLGR